MTPSATYLVFQEPLHPRLLVADLTSELSRLLLEGISVFQRLLKLVIRLCENNLYYNSP